MSLLGKVDLVWSRGHVKFTDWKLFEGKIFKMHVVQIVWPHWTIMRGVYLSLSYLLKQILQWTSSKSIKIT